MSRILVLLVALLAMVAGCNGLSPQPDTDTSSGEKLFYDGYVDIFSDTVIHNESTYYRNGSVRVLLPDENRTLRNVMLCVYGENQTVWQAIELEPVTRSTNPSADYEIDLPREPAKVVPYHPAFWEYEDLSIDVIAFRGERPSIESYESQMLAGELPVSRDTPAGQCA